MIEKNGTITDKQEEALEILQEECAEVIQVICKIERFGIDNYYPNTVLTNKDRLNEEVGDLLAMVDILIDQGILSGPDVINAKHAKGEKLKTWSNLFNDVL